MNPNQDNKNNKGGQGPKKRGFFVGALVWALVLVIIFNFIAGEIANAGTKEVTYSEFIQMVENNEVATAELANKQITFYLSKDLPAEITQPSGQSSDQDLAKVLAEQMEKGGATCYITAPPQGQGYRDDDLLPVLKQHNVAYAFTMEKETSLLMNMLLSYVLPVVIMTGALIFIMRRMGGPGGHRRRGQGQRQGLYGKVHRRDLRGCGRSGRGERIPGGDHRLPPQPRANTPRSARSSPRARCSSALRAPARRCWPRPWRARQGSPSSPSPALTLWRCSWAWARAVSGTSSRRPAKVAPCIIFIDEIDTIGKSRDNAHAAATTSASRP